MSFIKRQKAKYGYYNPVNPKKYVGSYPICLRSSWEKAMCRYCDYNEKVISWSSETIAIPYKHPFLRDNKGLPKTSRYYPDFLLTVEEAPGKFVKYLVEVKPYKETIPPKVTKKKSQKTRLYESKTWAINSAKWKAAERYCRKMGYKFIKITEKELIV